MRSQMKSNLPEVEAPIEKRTPQMNAYSSFFSKPPRPPSATTEGLLSSNIESGKNLYGLEGTKNGITTKNSLTNFGLNTENSISLSNGSASGDHMLSRSTSLWRMLDYGVTAEQGTRKTMEDQHIMLAEGIPFFGVYDGHGGTACAEYLRDNLHSLILSHAEVKTNPEKAIKEGISKADNAFLKRCEAENIDAGCVCAICILVGDKLVVANVGDTEVMLCRDGNPLVLTEKHSPQCNPKEETRIIEAGGKLVGKRVGHPRFNPRACSLAVSRALGDAAFKLDCFTGGNPSGVISDPMVTSIKLQPQDEFLVIGCDGLWDVLSHKEVSTMCRKLWLEGSSCHDITEALVEEALLRGSSDNVTVAFVALRATKSSTSFSRQRSSAMSISISRKGSDCFTMSK